MLETIRPRWHGLCVVAATGPSLTPEVAEMVRGQHIVAVNDAYRLMPFAEILYAADVKWWEIHQGCPDFQGEKWTTWEPAARQNRRAAKTAAKEKYGLRLVDGRRGNTFSTDPERIHWGDNSGFQGINLAILLGAAKIVLVGFDMRTPRPGQKRHFFGDHPGGLNNHTAYERYIPAFNAAAKKLPDGVEIINATPGSALECFPRMKLEETLCL